MSGGAWGRSKRLLRRMQRGALGAVDSLARPDRPLWPDRGDMTEISGQDSDANGALDRVIYVCSSELDHGKLICDDAGPGYAESMNLNWATAKTVFEGPVPADAVLILCNRLSPSELTNIVEIKTSRPDMRLIAKIVDPWASAFGMRVQLGQLAGLPNTAFLSVYEPKEAAREFLDEVDPIRWRVVPYPYLPWREVTRPLGGRDRKAVLTGSMDAAVYPLRTALRDLRARDRLVRTRLDVLKHPGYADLGARHSHRRIGSAFIDYLSGYQLMFLCGTRAHIELMKYLECAYAGCAPFGRAPTSFTQEQADLVLSVSPDTIRDDVLQVFDTDVADLESRADRYRKVMRETRSQGVARAALADLVQSSLGT